MLGCTTRTCVTPIVVVQVGALGGQGQGWGSFFLCNSRIGTEIDPPPSHVTHNELIEGETHTDQAGATRT